MAKEYSRSEIDHDTFVSWCHALGIKDVTLHQRKIAKEPLNKEDWNDVYVATMTYEFQLTLIVARAKARQESLKNIDNISGK